MNKLISKIVGVALGLSLAVGTGVAIAAGNNETKPAFAADTWNETAASSLATGDIVAIVDKTTAKAMSNNKGTSSAPSATSVTLNSDKTEITSVVATTIQWVVTVSSETYQFNIVDTSNYLYATNTNNGVRVGTNANNSFTITDNFLFNTATKRYIGVYNNSDWRCYTSIHANIQNTVLAFYKKTADTSGATLSVSPTSSKISVGGEVTLTATASGGSGSVSWSSSDSSIASLSATTGNSIKVAGEKRGNATITVSYSTATSVDVPIQVTQLTHAGTFADPYTVEEARDLIDLNTGLTGVHVTGIVSKITTAYDSGYGNVSFDMSTDGTTTSEQIRGFKTVGTTDYPIDSEDSIKVGDTVILLGNLTKYDATYELDAGNQLVYKSRIEVESLAISGSMTKISYTTAETWDVTGLVVTATMSDSTTPVIANSDVTWSFNPATPKAMGAASGETLTITATYEGKTDSTTVSVNVMVPDYTNTAGIELGSYYLYVMYNNTKYYFAGPNAPTTNSYGVLNTSKASAVKLAFDLVDDDVWNIDLVDANSAYDGYHLCLANNATGLKYSSESSTATNMLIEKIGSDSSDGYYIQSEASSGRTFAIYTTGPQIRFYAKGGSYTYNMYLEPAKEISGLEVYSTGANKNVLKGSTFDATAAVAAGFQARLTYTDSSYIDVSSSATWTLDTSVVNANATLTVTYSTYTAAVTGMNVYTVTLTSLTIDSSSAKTTGYFVGDALDTANLVITGHDSSANNYPLAVGDVTFSPTILSTAGAQTIAVSWTNDNNSVATGTYSVTVSAFNGYTKVTSVSGITVGDSYVVGGLTSKDLMGAYTSTGSGSNIKHIRQVVSGSSVVNDTYTRVSSLPTGVVEITFLSDGNGAYYIYDITSDAYLCAGETTASLTNVSSLADATVWTISFDETGIRIMNSYSHYLEYNNSSPRFTNYAFNNSYYIALYKKDGSSVKTNVTSFANNSLKMNDSAYDGDISTEYCAANYSAMKTAYAALSEAEKNVFQYSTDYANARARLAKWAIANGETFTYGAASPFAQATNPGTMSLVNNNNALVIVVITAFVTMTFVGGYFFLRKKKEN